MLQFLTEAKNNLTKTDLKKQKHPFTTNFDGLGAWLSSIEDSGEFIGIRFGRIKSTQNEPEWFFLPHSHFDGIGGFAHLLRNRGYPHLLQLPQIKFKKRPSSCDLIQHSLHYCISQFKRTATARLKKETPIHPQKSLSSLPAQSVAWKTYNRATTQSLLSKARANGVTLNSWLLTALDRGIRHSLDHPHGPVSWLIPVNMRGGIQLPMDTDNHASLVDIIISPFEPAAGIHRQIHHKLHDSKHWLFWHFIQKTAALGERTRQAILRKAQSHSKREWLGSFSNLGAWNLLPIDGGAQTNEDWLFCPPVAKNLPLGAGCVSFNGKLSLTLQIHPDYASNPKTAESLLNHWMNEL